MSEPSKSGQIEPNLTSQKIEVIDASLDFVKDLLADEKDRSQSVGSRSTNLLGFAGVIAGLTASLIDVLTQVRMRNFCLSVVMSVMYGATVLLLFGAVWWSLGGRRRAVTAVPDMEEVFEFQKLNEIEVKRKWLADLISSYPIITKDVNRRVTLVYNAQWCLTAAIGLLLVFTLTGAIASIAYPP